MATFQDIEQGEKLLLYNHIAWDGDIPIVEKAKSIPIKYDMTKEPLREECKSFLWLKRYSTTF